MAWQGASRLQPDSTACHWKIFLVKRTRQSLILRFPLPPAPSAACPAVLFRAEAAWALVRCLTSWPESQGVALPALRLLPLLLANGPSSRDHQKAFLQAHGAKAIAAVLGKHAGRGPTVWAPGHCARPGLASESFAFRAHGQLHGDSSWSANPHLAGRQLHTRP